jgi:hypothetical protein
MSHRRRRAGSLERACQSVFRTRLSDHQDRVAQVQLVDPSDAVTAIGDSAASGRGPRPRPDRRRRPAAAAAMSWSTWRSCPQTRRCYPAKQRPWSASSLGTVEGDLPVGDAPRSRGTHGAATDLRDQVPGDPLRSSGPFTPSASPEAATRSPLSDGTFRTAKVLIPRVIP